MKFSIIVSIILLSVSNSPRSFAEPGELLLPASESAVKKARAENDYFLNKVLYTAKQHRFVRVDKTVLESNGQVVISLFGEDKILFDPIVVNYLRNRSLIRWTGTLANPPLSVNELASQTGSEEEASLFHSSLFDISISASQYEYDSVSGANFPYINGTEFEEGKDGADGRFFYGVSFSIWTPDRTRQYRLRSIDFGGPLHILVEIDQSKKVGPVPESGTESTAARLKRSERQSYMESLGDDPKHVILSDREVRRKESNR